MNEALGPGDQAAQLAAILEALGGQANSATMSGLGSMFDAYARMDKGGTGGLLALIDFFNSILSLSQALDADADRALAAIQHGGDHEPWRTVGDLPAGVLEEANQEPLTLDAPTLAALPEPVLTVAEALPRLLNSLSKLPSPNTFVEAGKLPDVYRHVLAIAVLTEYLVYYLPNLSDDFEKQKVESAVKQAIFNFRGSGEYRTRLIAWLRSILSGGNQHMINQFNGRAREILEKLEVDKKALGTLNITNQTSLESLRFYMEKLLEIVK